MYKYIYIYIYAHTCTCITFQLASGAPPLSVAEEGRMIFKRNIIIISSSSSSI